MKLLILLAVLFFVFALLFPDDDMNAMM